MNGQRVQCPVGLSTLNFRHREEPDSKQPFVYLKCGHVHGKVDWGDAEGIFLDNLWRVHFFNKMNIFLEYSKDGEKTCPMCRQKSKCVALVVGKENAFHLNSDEPNFAFNPCGHTVR